MRTVYLPEELGVEVVAPSGYYMPREEAFLSRGDKRLLCVLGSFCIEASCCGVGSWNYLRVEGYVVEKDDSRHGAVLVDAAGSDAAGSRAAGPGLEIDTVEDPAERAAISSLLLDKHPGVRIEFR